MWSRPPAGDPEHGPGATILSSTPEEATLQVLKARTPAGLLPAGAFVRVLGSSGAGYFTLNERHLLLAAVCVAVLASVAFMR